MDSTKDHMSTLLDLGVCSSAQMLGCFLVSSNSDSNPHAKAENFVLFGDSLFRDREYRRAIHVYRQALQLSKLASKQGLTSLKSSFTLLNKSLSPSSFSVADVNENEVKFKIASCHFSLLERKAALIEMEGIPSKLRNIQMNLLMGKLYFHARNLKNSIYCYKDCIRQCPYAIEAITALAELGVSTKDIISLFPQVSSTNARSSFDLFDSSLWLQCYVEAQCCIASHDYKGGLDILSELLLQFPNNTHLLLEIAKVEAIVGKKDDAIMKFERVRAIDPFIMTYMDEYAMLLKLKWDYKNLNKLVHDLLNIDPTRAEVFVAMSALWARNDEREALAYAEKSIRIDDRNVLGYIMKGNLYLSMNRVEAAVSAFRIAHELKPNLRSYQGLVKSYLALSKNKEAMYVAREAFKAIPNSARALKLVGDVYVVNSGGRDKAKKFYESSLRLEPGYIAAALALADLHVMQGRSVDAVSLLERYLINWSHDSLHVKLAHIFAATNVLQEALSHYQAALRINSQNETAKRGLERLDKLMKGLDPDAVEADDGDEVEVGDTAPEDAFS